MKKLLLILLAWSAVLPLQAQDVNKYEVDLQTVTNDQVQVTYYAPATDQSEVHYYFPKIIPGTYNISDFGKFIHEFKAFDEKGKELPVEKITENDYLIKKANKLHKITYLVEDTYDTTIPNNVYPMGGTNIEDGANFVIGTPGFFGYMAESREDPFEITVHKPAGFYGSTALVTTTSEEEKDVYLVDDYDRLVDSPMMYNVPDTAVVSMGGAEVLVSVYSPNKKVTADYLSDQLAVLLENQRKYLGGTLPVDKYAFIYYFDGGSSVNPIAGALEHSYSSFYYLPEYPQEQLAQTLVDIAAHEFFHIVTPLTIHSEEIENFNFNEADLSRHLWLYEGITEYSAAHVQVRYGMISPEEYLDILSGKIRSSKTQYSDDLPFTELSMKAAGEYEREYGNVYEKGALIGAMLDIRLLDLSNGRYSLRDLVADLGEKYGADRAFKDEELFDVITEMTYPEIGEFFSRYVAGKESLPYKEYFAKAGIEYIESAEVKQVSLGNIQLGFDGEQQKLVVANISQMNEFGKRMGYQIGDRLLTVQGEEIGPENAQQVIDAIRSSLKEGDLLTVVVNRPGEDGSFEEVTLSQPVVLESTTQEYVMRFIESPSFEQFNLRNAWLDANAAVARAEDVKTVDGIITALYDVISGPAGQRDWIRFRSLFTENAIMGAVAEMPNGTSRYVPMTPVSYIEQHDSFLQQNALTEKELGREEWKFGKIVQIKTAYELTVGNEGETRRRGVNLVNLVWDHERWWITSILWTTEGEENPIPESLK